MEIKNNAIELKNLYCVFNENLPNEKVALKNINFSFEKGKIYFIIGKSGCGKSTLLSYFNGLSYPKYGSVKIDNFLLDSQYNLNNTIIGEYISDNNFFKLKLKSNDKKYIFFITSKDTNKKILRTFLNANDLSVGKILKIPNKLFFINRVYFSIHACEVEKDFKHNFKLISDFNEIRKEEIKNYSGPFLKRKKVKDFKEIRKKVGVVYQFPEYQLFKSNILEEVMFGPLNLGFSKDEAKNNSINILKYLSIPENYFDKSPFGLSGGQKRRVALSGILASNPEFLVFDEPTAGLDPKGEAEMLKIILESKKQGKTVFVVTHSMEQVLDVADEVIVMDDGQIVKYGKPFDIFMDKDIVNIASVILPNTITFINDLVAKNKKFEMLYKIQPRNVYQLADALIKIKKGKNSV